MLYWSFQIQCDIICDKLNELFVVLQERLFLNISNYVFTLIFLIEMSIKVNKYINLSYCVSQKRLLFISSIT